ncbi:mechanosensitive ion channel [Okibacterium endophyticum]
MAQSWIDLLISLVSALGIAALLYLAAALVVRLVARRRAWANTLIRRVRRSLRTLVLVIAVRTGLAIGLPAEARDSDWWALVDHLLLIATIAITAWFVCSLALFFVDLGLNRYRIDGPNNRVARRIRTQVLILRRLVIALIVIIAIGSILFTFPGASAFGASVLASAGLVSIVAGLAAQSTLANVFAGMQLAFSDAIRIDDVVIADGQWGQIEEITLTYVVVHIWDDRRMVLPSTYFTTTPFENWTRRDSELLGAVEFDLDWRVTPEQMRAELKRVVTGSDLWDGRTCVLQVTDAVGGFVRVRVLVSAADSGKLWDLRCMVREELIEWLHRSSPSSLPRTRVQMIEAERMPSRRKSHDTEGNQGLFSGDPAADERGSQFTGPIGTVDAAELDELDAAKLDPAETDTRRINTRHTDAKRTDTRLIDLSELEDPGRRP